MNNLAARLADEIATERQIVILLNDAARTERFLRKPKPPKSPMMYHLIETSYDKEDVGYYKAELKLRATPRQITRWEFAIDILLAIKNDISDDPMFDRKLLWLRANRMKWTQLQRLLGPNRTALRLRYEKLLTLISNKVRKEFTFDKLNRILYLI